MSGGENMKEQNMMRTTGRNRSKLLAAIAVLAVVFAAFAAIPAITEDSNAATVEPTELTAGSANITSAGAYILKADLTANVVINASGADVSIDLAGHTLKNDVATHTIVVTAGTLTITDSSEGKTGIVDNVSNGKAALYNANGATVVLNGGTFERSAEAGVDKNTSGGNSYYTIQNQGSMTVNGGVTVTNGDGSTTGKFSSCFANGWQKGEDAGTVDNRPTATLTINGGTFKGGLNTIKNDDLGILTINDGTFSNYAQHAFMNAHIATINGGSFEVETGYSVYSWGADPDDGNGYIGDGKVTINGGTFAAGIWMCNDSTLTTDADGFSINKGVTVRFDGGSTFDGKIVGPNDNSVAAKFTASAKTTITGGSLIIDGSVVPVDSTNVITLSGENHTISGTIGAGITLIVSENTVVNVASDLVVNGQVVVAGTLKGDGTVKMADTNSIITEPGAAVDVSTQDSTGNTLYPDYAPGTIVDKDGRPYVIVHAKDSGGATVQVGILVGDLVYDGMDHAGTIYNVQATTFDNNYTLAIAESAKLFDKDTSSGENPDGVCINAGKYDLHAVVKIQNSSGGGVLELEVYDIVTIKQAPSSGAEIVDSEAETIYGVPVGDLISPEFGGMVNNDVSITGSVMYFDGVWNDAAPWGIQQNGYYLVFSVKLPAGVTWGDASAFLEAGVYEVADGVFVKYLGTEASSVDGAETVTVDFDGKVQGVDNYSPVEYTLNYDLTPSLDIQFSIGEGDLYGKTSDDLMDGVDLKLNGTTLVFSGKLNYVFDYTGFSSAIDEMHGWYVAYDIVLPDGIDWADVKVETLRDGSVDKTFDRNFDGFFVLNVSENVDRGLRIIVDGVSYMYGLDFDGIEYGTYSGYIEDASEHVAGSGASGAYKIGGKYVDDLDDKTFFMIFRNGNTDSPWTGSLYYGDATGESEYSEPATTANAVTMWYMSFNNQLSDVKEMPGKYTMAIDNGSTGLAFVEGMIGSGFEIDGDAAADEILGSAGLTVTDAQDQTLWFTWYQSKAGYVKIILKSPSGESYEEGSYHFEAGNHVFYASFLNQLNGFGYPANSSIGAWDVKILFSEEDNLTDSSLVVADGQIDVWTMSASEFGPITDNEIDLFGMAVDKLQENIAFVYDEETNTYKVTGKSFLVKSYPGFWGSAADKSGYYLALQITNPYSYPWDNATVTFGSAEPYTVASGLGLDGNFVLYLGGDSANGKTFTFTVDYDGDGTLFKPVTYTVDMSDLRDENYRVVFEEHEEEVSYMILGEGAKFDLPMPYDSVNFGAWVDENGNVYFLNSSASRGIAVSVDLDPDGDGIIVFTALYSTATPQYWIISALNYGYLDGYGYTGDLYFLNDRVTAEYLAEDVSEDAKVLMNDFARYMGAVWRNSNGEIDTVLFNGVEYTWDVEGTLKGSNWKAADGTSLVTAVVNYVGTHLDITGISLEVTDVIGQRAAFTYTVNIIEEPVVELVMTYVVDGEPYGTFSVVPGYSAAVLSFRGDVPDGMQFAGWECNGVTYQPGDVISPVSDMTFNAVFEEVPAPEVYVIIFGEDSFEVFPGMSAVAPGYDVKEGMIFIGWQCGETIVAPGEIFVPYDSMNFVPVVIEAPVIETIDVIGAGFSVDAEVTKQIIATMGSQYDGGVDINTMYIVYDISGFTGQMVGKLYYGGDVIFSEPLNIDDGVRTWLFSWENQVPGELRNGLYRIDIEADGVVVATAYVNVYIPAAPETYDVVFGDVSFEVVLGMSVAAPAYNGDVPEGQQFAGWKSGDAFVTAGEIFMPTGNMTFEAFFEDVPKMFTVTWLDGNGDVLLVQTYMEGATPAYSGPEPTKAADPRNTYVFAGWPQIDVVIADVVYQAQFTAVPIEIDYSTDVTVFITATETGGVKVALIANDGKAIADGSYTVTYSYSVYNESRGTWGIKTVSLDAIEFVNTNNASTLSFDVSLAGESSYSSITNVWATYNGNGITETSSTILYTPVVA